VTFDHSYDRLSARMHVNMLDSNTKADVLSCLSARFHAFVYKLQSDEEFLTAIKDLLSGRIYVPRWITDCDDDTPEIPFNQHSGGNGQASSVGKERFCG
jgi:DNA-binding NarL/FixJ family response regulator